MLLERGGVGLNEDKTALVFQILDQIVPHLGVFVQVMKSCRDELFRESIYLYVNALIHYLMLIMCRGRV